jgi:hypothetical protein
MSIGADSTSIKYSPFDTLKWNYGSRIPSINVNPAIVIVKRKDITL